VAQLWQMQARARASRGILVSSSGANRTVLHQHDGCTVPVSRSISIAQRFAWPHKGQQAGSMVLWALGAFMAGVGNKRQFSRRGLV
jgi:hypothetical protein